MTQCSVLVVDDDPTIQATVADILDLEGCQVARADNGKEALALLERCRPDLILLDMRMPVMDGWAFARAVQERGWHLPIVVMTAARDARRWATEIGATDYLDKPFDLDDLLTIVARYCRSCAAAQNDGTG